ncbi:MAG: DinB family protein [Planctomycetota bacterium]|nr:DinB family protein [Planctomycetota bacterium]
MSTSTTINPADLIVPAARMSLGYLLTLAEDIPADRWAEPGMDGMNHPAFLYGHLAIYPNRVFTAFIDRADLAVDCPFDAEAVKQGAECKPDASLYATKDVVVPFLKERYESLIDTIPSVSLEIWSAPNPAGGRFAEMLPTVGTTVNFMVGPHVMMHAGQISHWRRAIGMGPAG